MILKGRRYTKPPGAYRKIKTQNKPNRKTKTGKEQFRSYSIFQERKNKLQTHTHIEGENFVFFSFSTLKTTSAKTISLPLSPHIS
mmetsp:Transcript_25527/g.29224  ORF Transcript_25527/g.29224 Transcript_25527/m.29224 type:complete len:85 (+) Transcript_25527:81-335(+)